MCLAKSDPKYYRCTGRTKHRINREAHPRFSPDLDQERHSSKMEALLSMTRGAIAVRRSRAQKYAREVAAVRTVHGLAPDEPIGAALREVLWQHRFRGATLSLIAMAARFEAIAADEGVPVQEIAKRYETQQIRPYRATAGERLSDLVVDPARPDWVDPERLVRMIEPPENGTPSQAYLCVVADLDGTEYALVRSFDGSEPLAYPHDAAGLKLAATEALTRVRAVSENPTAYAAWLDEHEMTDTADGPWTQELGDGDFLAHSDGMHLV